MSAEALRRFLKEDHPEVYRQLIASQNVDADVVVLNRLTGLNLRYDKINGDSICGQYLNEFRKGCPMANNYFEQYANLPNKEDWAKREYEKMRQMDYEMRSRSDQFAKQCGPKQEAPKITQPEPNPVLLLLGEDE